MAEYRFKEHTIKRTGNKRYTQYESYKSILQNDFSNRCAYCNLKDDSITSFFDIDHFVPKSEFKYKKEFEYLLTDYNNLIYSCHKCNLAKSNLFEGDLKTNPYGNLRFYNPVETDYNTVFYRDERGNIRSKDKLGIRMIQDLKLYQPIHNLNWMCERLDLLCEKTKIEREKSDGERKQLLSEAYIKLLEYSKRCNKLFIANYNNKKFSLT